MISPNSDAQELLADQLKQANAELKALNAELQMAYSRLYTEWDQFSSILNSIPQVIYVADMDTYEILFANQSAKDLVGRDITGETCFAALQCKTHPCEFCKTPKILSGDKPHFWEHYNESMDKHFYIMDRKIHWTDNRIARFTLAIDITSRVNAERELRKSEEILRTAHESANIGIMYVTGEGRIFYANPASTKIFGYSTEELKNMTVNEIAIPEDKEVSKKFIRAALVEKTCGSGTFTKSYYHKDGHVITCEVTSALLYDSNGQPLHFLSHIKDITKQKQAEEELRASEERYRLITENASDVIWILNITRRRFTYVSPSVQELRGYTPEEAMEQDIHQSLTPESAKIVLESITACHSKFLADPVGFSKRVFFHELKQPRKDGSIVWIETTTRYQFNSQGEVEVIGISRNINERKRNQERIETHLRYEKNIAKFSSSLLRNEPDVLNESLAHVRKAADCSHVALFQNIENGTGTSFAKPIAACCTHEVGAGTDHYCMPGFSYATGGLYRWLQAFQHKQVIEGRVEAFPDHEQEILLKNGIKSLLMIPVWSENSLFGFIGMFDKESIKYRPKDDIMLLWTVAEMLGLYLENQAAKQLLMMQNSQLNQANATKDRFISILGHDLRNPFNALLGLSDYLLASLENLSTEEIKDSIETIKTSSQSTFDLLNNLLDWSRNQQGLITINPQSQELEPLLRESTEVLTESARAKKIHFKIEIDEKITLTVDKEMFKVIARNLLSNAIKFTRVGGSITVSARRKSGSVLVIVQDNGIGMSQETVDSLFHIEKTQSTTGTAGEQGTGFGLLLCKEFTEKHGGSISVESVPDQGTCFTVVLPETVTTAHPAQVAV